MANKEGWVKVHRKLLDNPIWKLSTPEQKVVLIAIMLLVWHKANEWEWKGQKYRCEPGQVVTSLDSIVSACGKGISTQNVRTALTRFEKLGFLTNQSTKTGRLITVVNWDEYQKQENEVNKDTNKELTKRKQRPNKKSTKASQRHHKDLTSSNNDKNVNNVNNDENVKNDKNNIPPFISPQGEIEQKGSSEDLLERLLLTTNISEYLVSFVRDWILYKKEMRFIYQETGLKSLLIEINANSRKYGDVAVGSVIQKSIANGYQGICFQMLEKEIKSSGGTKWE